MIECIIEQTKLHIKRIRPLIVSTILFSIFMSWLLGVPLIIEPAIVFLCAYATLSVVEVHGTNFKIRLFSCDSKYDIIYIISFFLTTYMAALFFIFTVTGFLELLGIFSLPFRYTLQSLAILFHFISLTLIGAYYISAFFPTLMMGLFTVIEMVILIERGASGTFYTIIVTGDVPWILVDIRVALIMTFISFSAVLYKVYHAVPIPYGLHLGLGSRIFRIFARFDNSTVVLVGYYILLVLRYFYMFLPIVLIPIIYYRLSGSIEKINVSYILFASITTFLLFSVGLKDFERYRMLGIGHIIFSITIFVVILAFLNGILTSLDPKLFVFACLSAISTSMIAVAYRLRKSAGLISKIVVVCGVIMLGILYAVRALWGLFLAWLFIMVYVIISVRMVDSR